MEPLDDLLLAQPPWPALSRFLPAPSTLLSGYQACAGLVSIYACVATALSLSRRRESDPVAGATTALAVLLVAQYPVNKMLSMAALGAAGLFPAFAGAIFAVEVLHAFQQRKWGIKLSGGAPDVVVRSFAALLPSVTCVVLVWFVVHVLGIDLAGGIAALFRPLLRGGDSLYAVVIVVLIDSGLWLVGVHGISVLAAVRPLWLAALAQGGSGTTLAFAILLLFARSKQLRLVGEAGIVPAVFNINEPLLFGAPVVMNGKLAPPFIAAPVILAVISWCAMHFGAVRPPYIEVVWTLPAPIGAYLSSGGDLKALVLQLVNLVIALIIWWPFVRRYDRHLVSAEAAAGSTTTSGALPGRTPSSQ